MDVNEHMRDYSTLHLDTNSANKWYIFVILMLFGAYNFISQMQGYEQ